MKKKMHHFKDQYNSPQWQKKRLEIMRRDNWKCLNCKTTFKALHIHHLYYEKDTKIWEYDNECYVTLCEDCHEQIHELKKLSGIIAFKILTGQIDPIEL